MKYLAPLLLATITVTARGSVISSIERLDAGGGNNSVVHSANNFKPNWPVWFDYTFTFRTAPSYLYGADHVRTRYMVDNLDADYQLRVTLDTAATVYMLIDDNLPNPLTKMPWAATMGFTDTGDQAVIQISADNVKTTASIYAAQFPAGDLTFLQQNDTTSQSGMYTLAAVNVPEPACAALLAVGGLLTLRRQKWGKREE